jgi:hypothetical protein
MIQKVSFKTSHECTQLIEKKLPLCIKFWLKCKDIRDELALWEKKLFTRYSNLYMYKCEEYDYTLLRHVYHD